MDNHLDDEAAGENNWNGCGSKTALIVAGKSEVALPRDRAGSFDPQRIAK